MKRVLYIAITAALGMSITSCTKVIDVNLSNTDPIIVIQGSVTDTTGPYSVKITKTIDIDKNNNFVGLSGASVTISDDAGNSENLQEASAGMYKTSTLVGVPGRTYTLTVQVDGKIYTAKSTMPAKVAYDSVSYTIIERGDDAKPYATVHYVDPIGVNNYYRAIRYVDGIFDGEIFVESDIFSDGRNRAAVLRKRGGDDDDDKVITIGGTVTVEMQCIDKYNFDYLSQLEDADGESNSATPANPVGNITNGALGYFSAHTSSFKTLPPPPLIK